MAMYKTVSVPRLLELRRTARKNQEHDTQGQEFWRGYAAAITTVLTMSPDVDEV